jgi:hypothetical protein
MSRAAWRLPVSLVLGAVLLAFGSFAGGPSPRPRGRFGTRDHPDGRYVEFPGLGQSDLGSWTIPLCAPFLCPEIYVRDLQLATTALGSV